MKYAAHYLYISGCILAYPMIEEVDCGIFSAEPLTEEVASTIFESGYIVLVAPNELLPERLPFPVPKEILSDYNCSEIAKLLSIPRKLFRINSPNI